MSDTSKHQDHRSDINGCNQDVWKIVIGKRHNEGFNKDEINSEINFVNHNYPLVPRDQLNSSSGPSSTGSLGSSPTVASTLAQNVNNTNNNSASSGSMKPNKMSERTSSALSDDEEIEWMKIRCNEAPSERYVVFNYT